jgi:WD40 repeat protein
MWVNQLKFRFLSFDLKSTSFQRHRVQALCWSVLSPSTLFSADEVGNVVVWDARINSTRSLSFNGKHNVIVMRAAGHADDVVAIGCKKGLILVCSTTGSGKTLQRIRFHDEDVHDISWAPIGPNVFSEDGEEDDPLFAVSSRDRQMSVWSARTGRQRASMRIGPPYKQQQQRNDFFWFPCLWLRPDTLVTGGTQGEMVTWDLARLQKCQDGVFRGDDKRENVNILHREHNR